MIRSGLFVEATDRNACLLGLTGTVHGDSDSHLLEAGVEVRLPEVHQPAAVGEEPEIGAGGDHDGLDVGFAAYNNGPLPATGATVTFALSGPGRILGVNGGAPPPPPPPPGGPLPPSPFPPASPCTFTDTSATCALGDVAVYGYVPLDVLFEGTGEGLVTISGNISSDGSDPAPFNNSATASYTVVKPKVADLSVSISAPSPVTFNKPLTYTIVVANKGPDAATDAIVSDFLPPDVKFGSVTTSQGSCTGSPDWGYVWCDLGSVGAGASATIKVVATPTEGGDITNAANVFDPAWGTDFDPDPTNNFGSVTTTVRGPNPPVTTTASEQKANVSFGAWVDCAHEFVVFDGTLHESLHTTFNKSSGRASYASMVNPQGVKGVGLSSGTPYEATGKTRMSQTFAAGFPSSFDYEDVFHLVSRGAGGDLFVHVTNHVIFAADGTPKTTVSKYTTTCK